MKNIFKTAALLLTLLGFEGVFASCEKMGDKPVNIRVNVLETRLFTKSGSYVPLTNENVTSTIESNGFVLDAYVDGNYSDFNRTPRVDYPKGKYIDSYGSTNVTKSSEWGIAGTPKWVSDVTTQFWAYYPAPASFKGRIDFDTVSEPYSSMRFGYTMPSANGTSDASSNFDDPVFCHVAQVFNGSNETVDMTFHHALAQIRFCVSLDSTDPGQCESGYDISKIEICGVKNKGVCTFTGDNTFSWSGQTGDYIFGQNLTPVVSDHFTSSDWQTHAVGSYSGKICNYGFYVIPQPVSGMSLKVSITNGTKTVVSERDLPASADFAADNYYTYKLIIKGDALADITLVSANAIHQAFDGFVNLEY